jgi:exodeoxyribonuclease V gamma subunit
VSAQEVWELEPPLREWLGVAPRPEAPAPARSSRPLEVSIIQVRRFLECPLQGWARFGLRLAEDDEDDPATRQDEPFATDRLTATALLREVFLQALLDGKLDQSAAALEPIYEDRAAALARAGRMPAGLFRAADRRRHRACLMTWAAAAWERGLLARGPYGVHRFGRAAENERVDVLGDPIELAVPLGDDTVRVHLYGRTGIVARGLPGTLTPVMRDTVKDKDFLAGFLDALVLTVEKPYGREDYQLHILTTAGGGDPASSQRWLRGIDEGRARAYLTGVVADMLGKPHEYLLPCEAVFAFLGPKATPISRSIEAMVDGRESCSSEWGPVPDFTRYGPPDEDDARAMIESRFGLFRDCGALGQ